MKPRHKETIAKVGLSLPKHEPITQLDCFFSVWTTT